MDKGKQILYKRLENVFIKILFDIRKQKISNPTYFGACKRNIIFVLILNSMAT